VSHHRFGEIEQPTMTETTPMLSTLKTAALSAMIGLTALSALPAAAQAEGLYLNFGNGHGRAGVVFGDDDGYRSVGRFHGRDGRHACTPDRALEKAERMGLRRARIVDVSRRTITVAGRQYGDRVHVTFARAPRCPVID